MYINVLYFAQIKEQLGIEKEKITIVSNISILELKKKLAAQKKEDLFLDKNIMCAINHKIADNNMVINENDEVAFFPPITGG